MRAYFNAGRVVLCNKVPCTYRMSGSVGRENIWLQVRTRTSGPSAKNLKNKRTNIQFRNYLDHCLAVMMIDKAITSTFDVDALCCKGALTP